jgi:hypothetical protein
LEQSRCKIYLKLALIINLINENDFEMNENVLDFIIFSIFNINLNSR